MQVMSALVTCINSATLKLEKDIRSGKQSEYQLVRIHEHSATNRFHSGYKIIPQKLGVFFELFMSL